METLKTFIETCLLYCKWADNRIDRIKFMHQAFGATQFFSMYTHTSAEWSDIETLWEEYKAKFEELVYGVL